MIYVRRISDGKHLTFNGHKWSWTSRGRIAIMRDAPHAMTVLHAMQANMVDVSICDLPATIDDAITHLIDIVRATPRKNDKGAR